MIELNLPPYNHQVKKAEGKLLIFDLLRRKHVVLTPEEWVRQHVIHYMITNLRYPRTLIKVEGGLSYNQLAKRTDIVVFNREAKPWMVVECKSPDINITQRTLQQASMYNVTLQAPYLVVTNGMQHFYFYIDWLMKTTTTLTEMPPYV